MHARVQLLLKSLNVQSLTDGGRLMLVRNLHGRSVLSRSILLINEWTYMYINIDIKRCSGSIASHYRGSIHCERRRFYKLSFKLEYYRITNRDEVALLYDDRLVATCDPVLQLPSNFTRLFYELAHRRWTSTDQIFVEQITHRLLNACRAVPLFRRGNAKLWFPGRNDGVAIHSGESGDSVVVAIRCRCLLEWAQSAQAIHPAHISIVDQLARFKQ